VGLAVERVVVALRAPDRVVPAVRERWAALLVVEAVFKAEPEAEVEDSKVAPVACRDLVAEAGSQEVLAVPHRPLRLLSTFD